MANYRYYFSLALVCFLLSCGGTKLPPNPVKILASDIDSSIPFTVLLQDMDLKNKQYLHKYKVFKFPESREPDVIETDWLKVSDNYFKLHENDLGMEVLSRTKEGKYNNLVSPPGFTNVLGNPSYGSWQDSSEVWRFHPEYTPLETELGILGLPIHKNELATFQGKHLYNKPFYGEKTAKDSTKYGTRSRFWFYSRGAFYSRKSATRGFYKAGSTRTSPRTSRGGGGFGK